MAVGLFWNDRVSFEKHEWAKRFFFLGNNTGNLVFIRALKDIFHPVMIPLWDVTSDTFRDRADITHYITTELIWLTPNQTYPHVWTMLKRIGDKPLVPISVGVQSMARNVDITLHPDTVKLLRTMAERAVLGVRGEYTAAVLEKNPNYRNKDSLPVDTLNFRIISDGQTALTSFLAGELDMTELGTQQIVQQAEDAGYERKSYSDGSSFYAMVNCSDPQLSNVNLRRALALGFDKQGFIDVAIGLPYSPMKAFTAPAVNGADGTSFSEALLAHEGVDAMAPVNGDIEAAKGYLETALSELGITADQLTLSIDCGDSADAQTQAAFLQNQWLENLGIEVTINPKQTKQGSADRQNGNYQMSITGWSPDYNDPMTFLDMWVSDGGNNDTRWGTEEYDALIDAATVETDVNARQEMFYQCEETVFDQYFIIPIYNRTQSYVVSDKIANIQRSTFTDFNLMTVELA